MIRSLLFIPANTPGMLKYSDLHHADAIIFDLEDAISTDHKDAARHLLSAYLRESPFRPKFSIVRINQVSTPDCQKDLDVLPFERIQAVMLPKAEISNLDVLVHDLGVITKRLGLSPVPVIPILETPRGILDADRIAAHPSVIGLLLGAEDLVTEIRATRTTDGDEIWYARSHIVLCARANKVDAYDTPYLHIEHEDGLRKDALFAKNLGMTGKAAIHPSQLSIINHLFSPSAKELEDAKRILAMAEKHNGAFALDGKMIDRPIISRAQDILAAGYLAGSESDDE